MVDMPSDVGGDTLFASAYEMYDRMSPHYQKLCDGLMALHYQVKLRFYRYSNGHWLMFAKKPVFSRVLQQSKDPLITEHRGHPDNKGLDFKALQ